MEILPVTVKVSHLDTQVEIVRIRLGYHAISFNQFYRQKTCGPCLIEFVYDMLFVGLGTCVCRCVSDRKKK